jgi:Protein of unknown function (DUF1553)/Protein of unknown function (DUF1549)/Planctomycete cytochrome C
MVILRYALLVTAVMTASAARGAENPTSFEKDVRPIFKAMCFQCHGEEEKPKGKLDLRLVRLMIAGGTSGPSVVPGKSDESVLWERIESDEMPEGPKKLSAAQKAIIKSWIEQGAKTLRDEPKDVANARYTEEELSHWAWQPVKTVPVPQGTSGHPIDAFLTAKLAEKGIRGFSAEADKRTLIRRLTFDLHGLPPTPEQVDAFLKDSSDDAYGKLITRLLVSPRYGERWARYWLDVAGYAETDGNIDGLDRPRPHAWKYRDYVIRSINDDKPYSTFLKEQLAGDEMVKRPIDPTDPATMERFTASGFLRMAPDLTEASELLTDRNQAAADVVKVATSAALGLTVGCAQCHDHRYDPISHEDYHRLRAIFDPAFDLKAWKKPSLRTVDVTSAEKRANSAKVESAAKIMDDEIRKRMEALAKTILSKELAKVPEADRGALVLANETTEAKRTQVQTELLAKYPSVRTISLIADSLEVYDNAAWAKFEAEKKLVTKFRDMKPAADVLMVPTASIDRTTESRLLFRGDPEQPKQVVTPAELFVLARLLKSRDIPMSDGGGVSSGRRLAYANLLTDGTHPLTARVAVNRAWMHHFGKGLVNTPGDFGLNGERPSHPELLDFLAARFVADGWSMKKLHTLIVTSAAYRQRSIRSPELDKLDPDNRLLGRMSVRRLEAEAVRDSLLAVSGKLNGQHYGPSVPVTEDMVGRGVIGIRELSNFGKPYGPFEKVAAGQENRRSIYISANRSIPLSMLETFDLPVMSPNCDARKCSTVPPQSLMFLNDTTMVQHANDLTERLWKEGTTPEARVKRVFALLYAVEPTTAESKLCTDFLSSQSGYFRTHGDKVWLETVKKWDHAPETRAMEALVQTLLSANRFLYVD